jgi:hypothetical protein
MTAPQWHFEDFRLDLGNACLWHGAESLALPPKALHVLHYLATHPGRLVTKDELLDSIWPETAVTDAVVRVGHWRAAQGVRRYQAALPRHCNGVAVGLSLPAASDPGRPAGSGTAGGRARRASRPRAAGSRQPQALCHMPASPEPCSPVLRDLWRPGDGDVPDLWAGGAAAGNVLSRVWAAARGRAVCGIS